MSEQTTWTMDNRPTISDVMESPTVVAALTKAQTEMTTPAIVAHAQVEDRLRKAVKLLKELAAPPRQSWKLEAYSTRSRVYDLTGTKPDSREEAAELVLAWINNAWNA